MQLELITVAERNPVLQVGISNPQNPSFSAFTYLKLCMILLWYVTSEQPFVFIASVHSSYIALDTTMKYSDFSHAMEITNMHTFVANIDVKLKSTLISVKNTINTHWLVPKLSSSLFSA